MILTIMGGGVIYFIPILGWLALLIMFTKKEMLKKIDLARIRLALIRLVFLLSILLLALVK